MATVAAPPQNEPHAEIPRGLSAWAQAWIGTSASRKLAWWALRLPQVEEAEVRLRELGDPDLRKESLSLRYRAKAGESLHALLPEAYALCREAGRRSLGMRHFDVQILGGACMFDGSIVEMQTGEGKTLTATLPMYLYSLVGKGAHLATVNDYLAQRDAEWMRPLYAMLGVTVGVIQSQMSQEDRRQAYRCDITYGTAKEFGFDFLRDRLLKRSLGADNAILYGKASGDDFSDAAEKPVQREPFFCLVDEADSILIDEARTPLIIGTLDKEAHEKVVACYEWAAKMASKFEEDQHYEYDYEFRYVELTAEGRKLARSLPQPEKVRQQGLIDLYEFVERAIKCTRDYLRDVHYVVRDGEIVIVDEFTGRLGEGRKWRDGIHQAIEAKEGVEVTIETGQAARILIQDLFLRYEHLGGMTGTAASAASELSTIYEVAVVPIPTNRPNQRKLLPERVFGSSEERWAAVVEEIKEMHEIGRPVLVGTRSIERSALLSRMLDEERIPHRVLNAHHVDIEAEIVAEAGQQGKVMVATNMAGRGTDIKLGEGVAALGGLHVIVTEFHESARIDRQLIGRCARQGDPGTARRYAALDDEILARGYDPDYAEQLAEQGKAGGDYSYLLSTFQAAQSNIETKHEKDRTMLMHYEKQRKKMQVAMGVDPYLDTPN